eukprot:3361334-Rhodomonas_salina.2
MLFWLHRQSVSTGMMVWTKIGVPCSSASSSCALPPSESTRAASGLPLTAAVPCQDAAALYKKWVMVDPDTGISKPNLQIPTAIRARSLARKQVGPGVWSWEGGRKEERSGMDAGGGQRGIRRSFPGDVLARAWPMLEDEAGGGCVGMEGHTGGMLWCAG